MDVVFSMVSPMSGTMSVFFMLTPAVLSVEGQEDQPERIKWREESSCKGKNPYKFPNRRMSSICGPDNLVLAEESRKPRESTGAQSGNYEHCVGNRQIFFQPAHFLDIIGMNGMDDTPCCEEEESLEECMRVKMKNTCGISTHT